MTSQNQKVRVRFAPSPTGALHIGGVRTALYNYLFAKQNGGDFILRIEDTDQNRYMEGAEDYIMNALLWTGLVPDESPLHGGKYGPYRQSERMSIYQKYGDQLVESGHAYYAFDTPESLEQKRSSDPAFKYDSTSRPSMDNSLSLDAETIKQRLSQANDYVIRMKIEAGQSITIEDTIRGAVTFSSDELDDKVIIKGDGMPTYHLANIIDDHLMDISHVIRGEEWLPSTAHHVLLYRYFGWESPVFAHLPLILKPTGQGKLSKRDGATFGFPVFPLDWKSEDGLYQGFRETGFLPEAVINFLGLMGWSPGNDEEIFSIDQLVTLFSLDRIHKAGARFDYDKAKWFNQHYIIQTDNQTLASILLDDAHAAYGENVSLPYLASVCGLMKERVHLLPEILEKASFFFTDDFVVDEETFVKKWKAELKPEFENIAQIIQHKTENAEVVVKQYIQDQGLKMGDILPILRLAVSGTMQGPDLFASMFLLGNERAALRIINCIKVRS